MLKSGGAPSFTRLIHVVSRCQRQFKIAARGNVFFSCGSCSCIFLGDIFISTHWTLLSRGVMSYMALGMTKNLQASEKKWGANLAKAGFTILPNHLIAYNQFAEPEEQISATEFFVLTQILVHWWSPTEMPFPSKSTLSSRTGLSPRQVQRTLGQLEDKRLIRRIARFGSNNAGRMSNAYDLAPLVSRLKTLAEAYPSIQTRAPEKPKPPSSDGGFDHSE